MVWVHEPMRLTFVVEANPGLVNAGLVQKTGWDPESDREGVDPVGHFEGSIGVQPSIAFRQHF